MTCEQVQLRLADELAGAADSTHELESHLAGCQSCREEAARLRWTWARLGSLPEPEPSPWMSARFHASLNAWQHLQEEKPRKVWNWWPAQPAWQMAISAACLAVGVWVGTTAIPRNGVPATSPEIAQLQKEMNGMRQLVTLSLLQQQSASERLRGVTYSYRAEPNDLEVLSALLRTISNDVSVDVRLAAIEAVSKFSDSPVTRRGLTRALSKQDSPLVEVAIIDALVDMNEKSSVDVLERLKAKPDLDVNVRQRIDEALKRFE